MEFRPPVTLARLFTTFLAVGAQSFGGGSSTLYLIHQACVQNGWLEEDEFVRAWALVQISPGINLLKLVRLVGYQLRGWAGLLATSSGLLLPSALATVLMTAGFTAVRQNPLVQAALKGVLPATIGLSLAMAAQMGLPLLAKANQEGRSRLALHVLILAGAALLMGIGGFSPVLVLLLSGIVVGLLHWAWPVKRPAPGGEGTR